MAPQISSGTCWKCGTALTALDYGRQDSCRKCGFATRVCFNCVHHNPGSDNECHEPQAERVVEKERSNFCDYFSPKIGGAGDGSASRDAMKAAAEALFGKK